MPRIPYKEMQSVFFEILLGNGFDEEKAAACAEIFTVNSLEGIYTHGVNRFPRFISYTNENYIFPDASPVLKHTSGSMEQWDGQLGPGPLNAVFATDRAVSLAQNNGIGMVALGNTNHWMRGGYYAWLAARKNCILIAWTNTMANMPAWGSKDAKLGNNPLVIGIPHNNEAIVLDMAMSQFSHGKLDVHAASGQPLPVPGGYDTKGNLSTDAAEILAANRKLPTGFWKGAGMSLLLDLLAMVLSGGQSVAEVSKNGGEYGLSQVFIAIDISRLSNYPGIAAAIDTLLDDYHAAAPLKEGSPVLYPGQRVMQVRKENMEKGIPVEESIWESILALHKNVKST